MIIPPVDKMPDGWNVIKGATNHPKGYVWICNGKSMFSKERKIALLKINIEG